jgi:hypothetical protein
MLENNCKNVIFSLSKGKKVNIPLLRWGYFYGNVNELWYINKSPSKSSLFLLIVFLLIEVSNNFK